MTFYCPECGGSAFSFGSTDETEGCAYFWCKCGYGPVKFPIGEGPAKKPLTDIIDADKVQKSYPFGHFAGRF
jgi:hypothetical protein